MSDPNLDITMTLPVSDKLCKLFLTAAYEGACRYWLACDNVVYTGHDTDDYGVEKIIGCVDAEDDSTKWGDADLTTIRRGIQRILDGSCAINATDRGHVLAAVLDDDNTEWDHDTADCVMQAGLLGELVYG